MKINYDRLINKVTLLYGLIPIYIFFFGWLRPLYSILAISLVAYASFTHVKRSQKYNKLVIPKLNWPLISLVALLSFCWVYCSGIGGYTNQDFDHHIRNAIFHDLLVFTWPVYYDFPLNYHLREFAGNHSALNYYFTFWLPAAFVGKWLGIQVANAFLLLWAYLGLLLSFYYLNRLFNFKHTLLCVCLFILWGNFDLVSYVLVKKVFPTLNVLSGLSYFPFYTSFTADLFNPFNQAIPAWLFSLYVFNDVKRLQLFPVIILLAYSPFAFIGLALAHGLYYLVALSQNQKKVSGYISNIAQSLWHPDTLGSLTILIIYVLFYQAHSSKVRNAAFWTLHLTRDSKMNAYIMVSYLLTFFLETGIYLSAIYFLAKRTYHTYKVWYWLICIVLMLLPLWVIGVNNDLASRASIPFLTALVILTLRALLEIYETQGRSLQFYAILGVLLFSFYWPVYSFIQSVPFSGKPILKNGVGSLGNPKIDALNDPDHIFSGINNFYSHEPQHFFFYQHLTKQ